MGLKFTMNERLETIQKLDETILENTKGRDIEKEVEDCREFCAKVYRILARIDWSLEDAKNSVHLGTSPSFSQINNNVRSNEGVKAKLPKLELKSFSGKYENGRVYGTLLNLHLTETLDISRIQKFTYLKSCVTGVVESAITGLPLTEDNYETAIDILRDRFGKPELLISNHMDALVKLPIVSSVHETKKLLDLYDKIDRDKHSKFEGTRHRIRVLWKFISSSCNGENSF